MCQFTKNHFVIIIKMQTETQILCQLPPSTQTNYNYTDDSWLYKATSSNNICTRVFFCGWPIKKEFSPALCETQMLAEKLSDNT